MTDVKLLNEIAVQLAPELQVATGKWFGKPCLKVGGRVFAALWGEDVAFKLTDQAHTEALQIEGAHLFDPRGTGHPMKEWVQIPVSQCSIWSRFARLACEYVAGGAQAKKDEIISGLADVRRRILDVASSLPPDKQEQIFLGTWSAKDLLAHLAGWDYTNLEAVKEILAGQRQSFRTHYDRDWASYNARLVSEYRREDFGELIALVEESHRELIDFLQAVPPNEYVKRRAIITLLGAEVKDERTHHRQLQGFAERDKM